MTDQPTSFDVREAATAWRAAGVAVLPIRTDGSKAPAVEWAKYSEHPPTAAEHDQWFSGNPIGLGLLCGAVSGGLEMFELEGRAIAEGARDSLVPALRDAGAFDIWTRLIKGYAEWTPGGGLHLLYRIADHDVPRNTKIAQRPAEPAEYTDVEKALAEKWPNKTILRCLAETRGNGGFVVVAPSHGRSHDTGLPWHLAEGSTYGSVPTITWDERNALHAVVRMVLDQTPEPAARPMPTDASRPNSGDRPGDAWAQQTTWPDVLEPHGWKWVYRRGDMDFWRRPGKNIGVSARTGGTHNGLYVWSSSTEFPTEQSITKFRTYAILEHRGDDRAAGSELRRRGFGSPPAVAPGQAKPGKVTTDIDESEWQPPVTEHAAVRLPEFPVHLLPPVLGDIAQGAAAEIQAPLAVAGMLALSVAASTLGGKVQFIGRRGHREEAMLWTWTVAASAERKTPVFSLLRRPLVEAEQAHGEQAEQLAARTEIELDVIDNEIRKLKKETSAANFADTEGALTPLLARKKELVKPPPAPCTWVTSPTPEGLHVKMAENGGRVAVFADEGGVIGIIAGRYSSKGTADLDPFLSGYVGQPLKAPRASKDRPDVPAAYLTIGLAVQPSVLAEAAEVSGAEERGLLGRFLFSLPDSKVGTRMYNDSIPVPEEVERAYADAAMSWARWGPPPGQLRQIGLTSAAYDLYAKFHDSIEVRQRDGRDLSEIPSWAGKLAGTTLRIAGIMHCYGTVKPLEHQIEEDTVRAATELAEQYLIPHAKAAFSAMRESAESRVTRRILAWIVARDVQQFRMRDLFQGLKGARSGIQRAADLEAPLASLIADGYLRQVPSERADSLIYVVNPLWDRTA